MSDDRSTDVVRLDETGEVPVIEVTVAAPVETVWPYLRDPQLIRRWHGWEADELDAEIKVIYLDTVVADDENHVLTGTFPGPDGPVEADRFSLHPDGPDRTIVRITRGPRGIDPAWSAMYDDVTQGWISFLAQLRFAVDQHLGEDRRTVFVGAFTPGPPALDLLGLSAASSGPIMLTGTDPPPVTGTTWFRAPGQVGLFVPEYGPGLVVVADKPGADPDTAAVSMVIVTTYGLTDAEHADVEQSWTAWWTAHHPAAEPQPAG